jgi:hypothetical protein
VCFSEVVETIAKTGISCIGFGEMWALGIHQQLLGFNEYYYPNSA